jgi:pimeloyl-ACP methyl ester carboxylesterase
VLVGHSLSGEVLTAYAGAHPEKVAALVYVDAVGDFGAFPREALEAEMAKEAGFGLGEWRREFEEMLGAKARPETRDRVLAALERTDLRAIGALRRDMIGFSAKARLARWSGPALAMEAAENAYPIRASQVLGIPRTPIPGVSHWLMLDAPAETNAALDAFLAKLGR